MVTKTNISETKIRQVIWMLKVGKTKKACCEHLGIAYNTPRLTKVIEEFKHKEDNTKRLKEQMKKTLFPEASIKLIINDYVEGKAVSRIAEEFYVSSPRIKKVLEENNVPLRGRGKKTPAKVEHVTQDLEVRFKVGDKVFIPGKNTYGMVTDVWDEDKLEYFEAGQLRSEELAAWNNLKDYQEPVEGVHFETYVDYDTGPSWKRTAVEWQIKQIEEMIAKTGREYYTVYIGYYDKNFVGPGYEDVRRENLYPVIEVNN